MKSNIDTATLELPWYKQFWPWMIIFIPATAVIMGIIVGYLVVTRPAALVKDDWYQSGKAINQELKRDKLAMDLGLSATVKMDAVSGEIFIEIQPAQEAITKLKLNLYHPTQPAKDLSITLNRLANSGTVYRAEIDHQLVGRRSIVIEPVIDSKNASNLNWRLYANNQFMQPEMKLPAQ